MGHDKTSREQNKSEQQEIPNKKFNSVEELHVYCCESRNRMPDLVLSSCSDSALKAIGYIP